MDNTVYEESFKNDPDNLERILLHSEGKTREELLDIKPIHFSFITAAKKWYRGLKSVLDTKENNDKTKAAKGELKKLYNEMVDNR